MPYDANLDQRIALCLSRRRGIKRKTLFGGVGFLLYGNLLVGVWKDSLIVRLDPADAEAALREDHVVPFDITGKPMRGWLMVRPEGLRDEHLGAWIDRAFAYVKSLPKK